MLTIAGGIIPAIFGFFAICMVIPLVLWAGNMFFEYSARLALRAIGYNSLPPKRSRNLSD